jgi:hypothetical protein
MQAPEYFSWFAAAQAMQLQSGTLTLGVPNDFFLAGIRRHRQLIDEWSADHHLIDNVVFVEDSSIVLPEADTDQQTPRAALAPASPTEVLAYQRQLGPGIIAHLLAERGFWTLSPAALSQMQLFELDDLHGALRVIPSAYGASGMREAMVFSGLLTIWGSGDRATPTVETSLKHLADVLGLSWSGNTAAMLRESILLLKFTNYYLITQHGDLSGRDDAFSILDRAQTEWTGPPSSPHRRVRAVVSEAVFEQISDRSNIRPIDLNVLRSLGEQRQLARRLYLLLYSLRAHDLDRGTHYIHRVVDDRLAGTLGVRSEIKHFRMQLARAGQALMQHDPRYTLIDVVPRSKRHLRSGAPRYLLRAFRTKEPPAAPQR